MTVIDYAEIVAALRAVPGVAEADVEPDAEGEGLGGACFAASRHYELRYRNRSLTPAQRDALDAFSTAVLANDRNV